MNNRFVSIFTIGHSNHTLERFLELLKGTAITAIADVRSAPYSRFQPQFNKDRISRALKENGIAYVFLGKELGARSEDPTCYENGRVQYRRLAETAAFHAGIERVLEGSSKHRVALMCAEKEPLDCHRTLLVGRALERTGAKITHIHADGCTESNEDAMHRLLDLLELPRTDLFRSEADLIEEACRKQEARVAYVDDQMSKNETESSS